MLDLLCIEIVWTEAVPVSVTLLVTVGQALPFHFSLHADACSFGAVVDDAFFEPRVLQSLLGRDACFGVVDEDLPE